LNKKNADIAKHIEHTLLKADAGENDIRRICIQAEKYKFAAVCVSPAYVSLAFKLLKKSRIRVVSVCGFPLGGSVSDVKAHESHNAVEDGADEIDMVANIGYLKSERYTQARKDIEEVRKKIPGKVLKVIIETSLLDEKLIERASVIAEEAGADYVKTSTGYGTRGATVKDIEIIRNVLSPRVKIKASGGIRTAEQARGLINAGADRIGTSSSINIIKCGSVCRKS